MHRIRFLIFKMLFRDDLSSLEGEIEEEFRFHIDMKAASLEAGGMSPEQAREAAEKCFGDPERLRKSGLERLSAATRREQRGHSLGWIGQDLRDGFRQILRHPGFALLAAGTLALGLSTSTAIFTYVNAYNRPFPGADARNLFQLYADFESAPFESLSYPDFLDLTEMGGRQWEVAATGQSFMAASVRHETLTEVVFGQGVTGNFFPLARVEMSLGRGLSAGDDLPGSPPAVVISHRYWVKRYGTDPDVLGRLILLNNQPYSIVGVSGPDFLGSQSEFRPDIWLPFSHFKAVYWAGSNTEVDREEGAVIPYLRLANRAGTEPALETLDAFARRLNQEAPLVDRVRRFRMEPATWIHPSVHRAENPTTRIMLWAAACLLLLACANVANLVLSAGTRRDQELALRSAMGASRRRLVRQLLAETLLLSGLAGAVALVVAGPMAARISSYFARPSVWGLFVPRDISIDPRVLAFAFVAALLTGMLTGLLPALRASGRDIGPTLRRGGRWSSDGRSGGGRSLLGTRELLVSVQVGLSVALLFIAGLVLRTLDLARDVDPGFEVESTLACYISTSSMGLPPSERGPFYEQLRQRFEEMPWVLAATVAENAPLSGHPTQELFAEVRGDDPIQTTIAGVVPGYFEALEIQILRGRSLLPTDAGIDPVTAATTLDAGDATGVVVVNQTLAGLLGDPKTVVGSTLWWPGEEEALPLGFQVVGVARDVKQTSFLEESEPVAYLSYPQDRFLPGNAFLLKVAGDPFAAVQRVEQELHSVDPRIAIVNILPYSEVVGGFLYTQRMNAELFSVIAILGLILAASGVFGVVNLAVARRKKEIGIRLAMGATRGEVTRLILSRICLAVVFGLVLGLFGAIMGMRFVEGLLWGVGPMDPLALSLGVSVLLGAMALAVSLPLRHALTVDPAGSLQAD